MQPDSPIVDPMAIVKDAESRRDRMAKDVLRALNDRLNLDPLRPAAARNGHNGSESAPATPDAAE
jgi:hypothetical protein